MKELLAVLSLVVVGTVAEPPAPYPPSGWRPNGPAFDLPQRASAQQPSQQYLPIDPRNPGPTEADVSVQGLPQPEQRPLFQASPIAGRQFSGPGFDQDLRNLDKSFQQSQYQQQQERYREYQRQRELDSQTNPTKPTTQTNRPAPNPRQFAQTESTTFKSTTDINLNQGEVLEPEKTTLKTSDKEKTSVEVTKQDVKEFPGEFFLSSLAQLQLQPQFVRLETGQIQPFGAIQQQNPAQPSSAYIQPNQYSSQIQPSAYIQGFVGPAHFSALPSVLAQQAQKMTAQDTEQNQRGQVLVQQPVSQFAQAQVQTYQPLQPNLQVPAPFQPNIYQTSNQEPVFIQPNSYQPAVQPDTVTIQPNSQYGPASYQPIQPVQPQFIAQPVAFQPQQPSQDTENIDQENRNQDTQNQNQFYQQPIVVPQFNQPGQFPQPGQPQFLQQPGVNQFVSQQNQFVPQTQTQFTQSQFQPQSQPEVQYLQPQYAEPQNQYGQPQFLQQPADIQNQYLQPQNQYSQPQLNPQIGQQQGQFQQPQVQLGQPQSQFGQPQSQFKQPQSQFKQRQIQFGQPQQQFQGQDNLQSGFDVNQEGNDIEDTGDKDDEATAIATAFGTRTQPRVNTRYGAPFPVPRVQANPGYSTTTESADEEITEDGPAVAQAVAVADGGRRKSARLRNRRVRPVYAVDRSGRLVLAEA